MTSVLSLLPWEGWLLSWVPHLTTPPGALQAPGSCWHTGGVGRLRARGFTDGSVVKNLPVNKGRLRASVSWADPEGLSSRGSALFWSGSVVCEGWPAIPPRPRWALDLGTGLPGHSLLPAFLTQ